MNHEYRSKIANESRIIRVKRAGIMNIEGQMIPLPPPSRGWIRGIFVSDLMWHQKKCFRQCGTERGYIEHVIIKRYSYFFHRRWQVGDFSVIALCF